MTKQPSKPTPDWDKAEQLIKTTQDSLRSIAARCAIPEPSLRRRAKAMGWIRMPSEEKRRLVSEAMAGVTHDAKGDAPRQALQIEAADDIKDMRRAVRINRDLLEAMEKAAAKIKLAQTPDAKEARVIAETTEKAVNGLRRIRELDKPVDVKSVEELDAAIDEALADLGRPRQAGLP